MQLIDTAAIILEMSLAHLRNTGIILGVSAWSDSKVHSNHACDRYLTQLMYGCNHPYDWYLTRLRGTAVIILVRGTLFRSEVQL
jgi:hypothetical protein